VAVQTYSPCSSSEILFPDGQKDLKSSLLKENVQIPQASAVVWPELVAKEP